MAIAFDAATSQTQATATSITFAHVCAASAFLWVGAFTIDDATDVVTGVTYNAVAMTRATDGGYSTIVRSYLYYLSNPSSGSNNVVVSLSGSHFVRGLSSSYTGVTGGYDASTFSSSNSPTPGTPPQDFTTTLSVSSANAWTVLFSTNNENVLSGVTNATIRSNGTQAAEVFDSAGVASGSYSMTIRVASGSDVGFWCTRVMGSMKETGGGDTGTPSRGFNLLGVGQ